jgi:signal transduction histidine kinase
MIIVFTNIIINAIEAMGTNGLLNISITESEEAMKFV